MNLNRKLDIYHVRHIFTYHESCADCAVRQPQKGKKKEKKNPAAERCGSDNTLG
jgi:hypothetical protein